MWYFIIFIVVWINWPEYLGLAVFLMFMHMLFKAPKRRRSFGVSPRRSVSPSRSVSPTRYL